jgi:hypothetical protein
MLIDYNAFGKIPGFDIPDLLMGEFCISFDKSAPTEPTLECREAVLKQEAELKRAELTRYMAVYGKYMDEGVVAEMWRSVK